ncbi:MAG TPA: glucan biosynthesis protein G [Acetobacteraceae bacterium]|nr:glucan biosynthesis protein G [Acetobacteraceae bacterium]
MRRREILRASVSLPILFSAAASPAAADPAGTPFDRASVRELARQLAEKPYQPPDSKLPDELEKLDYQQYRSIRFDPSKALWRGQGTKFTAEFFHRGFLYNDKVDIFQVVDGHAQPIDYNPDLFIFDKVKRPTATGLGFAGFRLHYPLNRADYFDEVCVFLGASYFRALAKGQGYGLSARGLAIKTADPSGEEFPVFKQFWLEKPPPGSDSMVVHALLDSPSTTGAFRFTLRPGQDTMMDTETALYPRVDIDKAGLAPLTSMYFFDTNDRAGTDDYREAVHDSSGLQLRTGQDEWIWRPLCNPRELQLSAFSDISPRGFGLSQRERRFSDYQDLEAHYEKRPSLWVEPIGDWGQGVVELVEIPSKREVNDNIVGFWRPHDPLKAKTEYTLNYRLHWCWTPPGNVPVSETMQTRTGLAWNTKHRQFVIDFVGPGLKAWQQDTPPPMDVGCDKGKIVSSVVERNPYIDGWRVSIELDPQDNKVVELHARLMNGAKPLTETWVYRWTPS